MANLIVVENVKQWPLQIPDAQIVPAREYLADSRFLEMRRSRVFNLCRTYGYQSVGYYVSLLATARGHKPLPSVTTIQDIRLSSAARTAVESIDEILQSALAPLRSNQFVLSIYFGRNLARRYDRLCRALFNLFPAPMLRAEFRRVEGEWRLSNLRPIASNEIPEGHHGFVVEQAEHFFARGRVERPKRPRYELAILLNPEEVDAPSDAKAIKRFIRAAKELSIGVTLVEKEDFGRLSEFDALFIRETTAVNHYTYRFARRAEAEGLVVIDDPESIVRCGNKVYQAEIFARKGISAPKTLVLGKKDSIPEIGQELGYPVVIKKPDSSFSLGVVKADDEPELAAHLERFFKQSELLVAQEFVASSFDWRIGVLDGQALFACKYHMARGHWQVQKVEGTKDRSYGKVETLSIYKAPKKAVRLAVRAAACIGTGLYGVDIKETVDGRFLVMEINDNPNIDAGSEDAVLKDGLYDAIMRYFYDRLERS
jgi:glutathione synthase/RimK-type ligase-like ATP-grasp enzyme